MFNLDRWREILDPLWRSKLGELEGQVKGTLKQRHKVAPDDDAAIGRGTRPRSSGR